MRRSSRFHRFIASSVTALLAANSMVLLVGLADNISDEVKPATELVVITNPDGSQTVVDPTTPEGWRAIEEATRRGSPMSTVPADEAPAGATSSTVAGQSTTVPKKGSTTTLLPDLGGPVTTVLNTVDSLVDDAGNLIDDTVRDTTDDVDDLIDDLTDVIDDNTGQDTGGLLDDEVDNTTDTIADTVDDTTDTVVDTVDDTTDTVDDVVNDAEDVVGGVTSGDDPADDATDPVGGVLP